MSAKGSVILFSENAKDIRFFTAVAREMGASFRFLSKPAELMGAIESNKNAAVVWDVDYLGVQAAPPALTRALPPSRSFALSEKTLNRTQSFLDAPFAYRSFQHNLIRKHDPSSGMIYSKLIQSVLEGKSTGLRGFFGPEIDIKRITLKASTHRGAAVQAVENVLQKNGFNLRMAAKLAQAADELLVNAIFDAAVDRSTGARTRHNMDRRAQFEFPANERVDLETASTPDFTGICVTDYFGTLSKESMQKFLGQNYETQDLKFKRDLPNIGLGLYGVSQSGLSLYLQCDPGVKTNAMVFCPKVKSMKDFKVGFQFTSCMME